MPPHPTPLLGRLGRLCLLAAGAVVLALPVHAGRPLATEDADVLDPGACEWESYAARAKAKGTDAITAWATQLGCGLGWRSQAALAWGRSSQSGDRTDTLSLVGKTALIARQDEGLGLTLAWGLSALRLPDGSFEHDTAVLNLVATRTLAERLTGHANLGWARSRAAEQDSTTWNLAAEYALGGGHEAMAELYGDDRNRPWLGAGWRWSATPSLSLNASAAVQAQTPRQRLLTLGLKLAF